MRGGSTRRSPIGSPMISPSTATEDNTAKSPITFTDVKSVEIIMVKDSTTSAVMMTTAAMLSHFELTHGPMISRSLHNNSTMMVVLGNMRPQMACTARVMSASG